MENPVYLALLACSGVSVFLFLLNIPLYLGKIKRNHWYGFRTPRTLSSDEIWYPINREAAQNFMLACCVVLLTSLVLIILKSMIPETILVATVVVVTFVSMTGAVIKSFIFLRKLK